jgi:hypothetical protein
VYHRWQGGPDNGWNGGGWQSLGGAISTRVSVGSNADGRLEVFARAADGAVYHRWQGGPDNGWNDGGWHPLGGSINSDISVGRNSDGRAVTTSRLPTAR